MMPTRIQRRRVKGFKLPPGTLVVTRGTEFGNPFKPGQWFKIGPGMHSGGFIWLRSYIGNSDGTFILCRDRAHAVEMFREYRRRYPLSEKQKQTIREAAHIACFCPLDGQPCHGDVLIELATL